MTIQLGDIKLFSVKELSNILGVTELTIRSYITSGKLKGRKFGTRYLVSEENLREYFKETGKAELDKKKVTLQGIAKGSVTDKDIQEAKQIWR